MPKRAYLEIVTPEGNVAFCELDPDRGITTIGRQAKNSVVVDHPGVAPFQAVLDHRRGPYRLIVLSKGMAMKLGGRLLSPGASREMHNLDSFELAGYLFILFEDRSAGVEPPSVEAAGSRLASPVPLRDFGVGNPIPGWQTVSWFAHSGQVSIPITNKGDREAIFRLEGRDERGECSFEFLVPDEAVLLAGPVDFRVSPGETVSVIVQITPLHRRPVGLGRQTHFCTVAVTMLGERPVSRLLPAQLQCEPLIGPGLTALLAFCLLALAGMVLQQSVGQAALSPQSDQAQVVSQAVLEADGRYLRKITPVPFIEERDTVAEAGRVGQVAYEEIFRESAQRYKLDWRLLARLAYRESRMRPMAVGRANEVGLMQVLPSTWSEWAPRLNVTDPFDPRSNVLVASAYLAYLRDYCSSKGYAGDYWMLAAYNRGPDKMRRFFDSGGDWAQLPPETRQYIMEVLQTTELGDLGLPAGSGTPTGYQKGEN